MPGGRADPSVGYANAVGPSARYRSLTKHLALASAAALLHLWQRLRDGNLSLDELAALGATSLSAADQRATVLADLYLAHQLKVRPLGLAAPSATDRLTQAIQTAASDVGTNPADALDRLGRAQPLQTGQTALNQGMRAHRVRGWTRVTGGSPCVVCAGLADGTVLSPSTVMYSHAGCSCVSEPVSD